MFDMLLYNALLVESVYSMQTNDCMLRLLES